MSAERFYSKGEPTYDPDLIAKIKRDAEPCIWHQDSFDRDRMDEITDFTGWIDENGVVRDICHILVKRDTAREEAADKKRHEMFLEMEGRVLGSTQEVEAFSNKLDRIADIRGKIAKMDKKLRDKYVQIDGVVRGSKKKRRFKKNNKRDLTDTELEKIEKERDEIVFQREEMERNLSIEDVLYRVFRRLYGIPMEKMSPWNQKYGYHRTEGIYEIYNMRLACLKDQINRLAYNEEVAKAEEKGLEPDIKLNDINVYDEIVQKVMQNIEEDIEYDISVAHRQRRNVTRKAKFFINERGERVEIGEDVKQVVLHNR